MSAQSLLGYLVAFLAVCYYNYLKVSGALKAAADKQALAEKPKDVETAPLLNGERNNGKQQQA